MDLETLHERLSYFPETGRLMWRKGNGRRAWSGKLAGSFDSKLQRRVVMLDGKSVTAAQVAWAMGHGSWPKNRVYTLNGNPNDLSLANLRDSGV